MIKDCKGEFLTKVRLSGPKGTVSIETNQILMPYGPIRTELPDIMHQAIEAYRALEGTPHG